MRTLGYIALLEFGSIVREHWKCEPIITQRNIPALAIMLVTFLVMDFSELWWR